MFEKKDQEQNNQVESIIGSSVFLEGNLVGEGDIYINGRASGKVTTKGNINIGETAEVNADIEATNIVVAGKVKGNLVARGKVELLANGSVTGDIQARDLAIALGSKFSGSCKMHEEQKQKTNKTDAHVD